MRVTTGRLRQIVVDPTKYVLQARSQFQNQQGFGNPQRSWMEGAIRAYFAAQRDPETLWAEFETRGGAGGLTLPRVRLVRSGEPMLEQFLQWDSEETSVPRLVFPAARDVPWQGHVLALRRDLVYLYDDGYRLVQLWTNHDLRIDHADAGMMVAALLIHADDDLGSERTKRIDVWHLRSRKRRTWVREDLAAEVERLGARLDEVESYLS